MDVLAASSSSSWLRSCRRAQLMHNMAGIERELQQLQLHLELLRVERALHVAYELAAQPRSLPLQALRGGGSDVIDGGSNAIEACTTTNTLDDNALIEWLRQEMLVKDATRARGGSRKRGKAHVAAALALARDSTLAPTRDDSWWEGHPGVPRGSRHIVSTTYKADVQALLPAVPPPALVVSTTMPVLQHVLSPPLVHAAGRATEDETPSAARSAARAASALSLSPEEEAVHDDIDTLYAMLPGFVYERNEHERLAMDEPPPRKVLWCGHVYHVPRPFG